MSRWMRVVRGVLGMGLTFGALAGAFFAVAAAASAFFFPGVDDDLVFGIIAGTVWGFGIGASFSAVLAIAARGRSLDDLSFARVALVGAAGGLVLAGLFVGVTWGDWPNGNAVVPFTMLPLLGTGGGICSLLLARKAGKALSSGDDVGSLGNGERSDT